MTVLQRSVSELLADMQREERLQAVLYVLLSHMPVLVQVEMSALEVFADIHQLISRTAQTVATFFARSMPVLPDLWHIMKARCPVVPTMDAFWLRSQERSVLHGLVHIIRSLRTSSSAPERDMSVRALLIRTIRQMRIGMLTSMPWFLLLRRVMIWKR